MSDRCLGYASDGPPFVYAQPQRSSLHWFNCAFVVMNLLCSTLTVFPVYAVVLSLLVSAVGFAVHSINPRKHPLFAETMHCIWIALAISLGHFMVFGLESSLSRQRSAAVTMIATKHVPLWFGFRKIPCVLILVFSLLLDWANGYVMMVYYEDEYTYQMAVTAFLWTCIYMSVAFAQLIWIVLVYSIENDLKCEKTAMEQLLSLLCDCQVLIHGNGDTVLRSSPIFDSLTGTAMEATQSSLGDVLSADDEKRLRDAFERARARPVILPISIRGESSNTHDVDFLIVKRGVDRTLAMRNDKKGHSGGANGTDDNMSVSFLVGIRITNVGIVDSGALEPSRHELAVTTCDRTKTNRRNDKVDLNDDEFTHTDRDNEDTIHCMANIADDHSDGRSIDNSTTVTGLVFRSFNTALALGERDSVNSFLKRITKIGRAEKWLVPLTGITLLPRRILGSGAFGIVVCGKLNGTDVAVKLVRTTNSDVQDRLPSLMNELRVLRGIHHPSLVQFFGACLDVDNVEIGLIFEKVSGVCLERFVRGSPTTPKDTRTRCDLICDIAGALRFLHDQQPPIVHSDLKPSNVMVESRGWESEIRQKAKLLDFGLARFATRSATVAGGTLQWLAPELLRNPKIVLKPTADVYSFGHILFFLITGIMAFEDTSPEEIHYRARLGVQLQHPWQDGVEPFARDSKDLVARCVNIHAQLRPPMERVHIDTLRWKRHHETDNALLDEEASWVEGVKILRSGKNLALTSSMRL